MLRIGFRRTGDSDELFGRSHGERIDSLVKDAIASSRGKGDILQSPEAGRVMDELREFMFEQVYDSVLVKKPEEMFKIGHLMESFYSYYMERPEELPQEYSAIIEADGCREAVKDFIAGMTDRYAVKLYEDLFVPEAWKL